MTSPWIHTLSGKPLDLLNPKPEQIEIETIATVLSRMNRFGGHATRFLCVAEHSVRVSRLCSPSLRLTGLLHDAAETYLGDMSSPLKRLLPEYVKIENGIMKAIAVKYEIEWPLPEEVTRADRQMLLIEIRDFMQKSERDWPDYGTIEVKDQAQGWNPGTAFAYFMQEWRSLRK